MRDALNRIFAADGPRTTYLTVSRRLSASRYELTDAVGRISYAESTDFYPAGAAVIVRDGAIVGPGKRAGKPKIYEV